jgi:hypothetical protein
MTDEPQQTNPVPDNNAATVPSSKKPTKRSSSFVTKLGLIGAGAGAGIIGFVAGQKTTPKEVHYNYNVSVGPENTSADPKKPVKNDEPLIIPAGPLPDYEDAHDWRHTKHKTAPTAANANRFVEQDVVPFVNGLLDKYSAALFGEYHANPYDDEMFIKLLKESKADCYVCEWRNRTIKMEGGAVQQDELKKSLNKFVHAVQHPGQYDAAQRAFFRNQLLAGLIESEVQKIEIAAKRNMEIILADTDILFAARKEINASTALRDEVMGNPILDALKRGKKIIGWFGQAHISNYPAIAVKDERYGGIGVDNVTNLPGIHFHTYPPVLANGEPNPFTAKLDQLPHETKPGLIMQGDGNAQPDYVITTLRRSNGAPSHEVETPNLPDNASIKLLTKILDRYHDANYIKDMFSGADSTVQKGLAGHLYCLFKEIRTTHAKAINRPSDEETLHLQELGKELAHYIELAKQTHYESALKMLLEIDGLSYEKLRELRKEGSFSSLARDTVYPAMAQALQDKNPVAALNTLSEALMRDAIEREHREIERFKKALEQSPKPSGREK